MSRKTDAQLDRYRSIQMTIAVFSIIFFIAVAFGYFSLLQDFGVFFALVGSGLIAGLAWLLARVAGTGERTNWALVAPLFIISAAGIFNTMMVYVAGDDVMKDATASAQRDFARVDNAASAELRSLGIAQKVNNVENLRLALESELSNKLNCGQGPEARRIISELQRELPKFRQLSGSGSNCKNVEYMITDYKNKIDGLVEKANWNDPELSSIQKTAKSSTKQLAALQLEIMRDFSPTSDIRKIRGVLESKQPEYQDLVSRLEKRATVKDIAQELDIKGAQSLGNVYKLPTLFFSRAGEFSTYVYLMMALGFDLFLVYLFRLARKSRVRVPEVDDAIVGAW